ncbi:tyrosine-type recombinase/integrase [Guptibacillus spartinae]|uniref:tyrosine-type recombinase/integrase n=1 Tax=Guptibacillus spartinae TaxID=3025679 RepID=UPI002362A782|nr:tyrosine-type recombinase/integrase [Pseudalkalibacillus spartinae]
MVNSVGPIKNIQQINHLKKVLLERSKRDYLLFVLSVNTGMRLAPLLHLTHEHVMKNDSIKEYLEASITETTDVYLNSEVRRALSLYMSEPVSHDPYYLFHTKKDVAQPITRQQVHRILSQAGKVAALEHPISFHSLRKTFGYHAFQQGVAVSLIQKIYGHGTRSETLKYIGINSNQIPKLKIDVHL